MPTFKAVDSQSLLLMVFLIVASACSGGNVDSASLTPTATQHQSDKHSPNSDTQEATIPTPDPTTTQHQSDKHSPNSDTQEATIPTPDPTTTQHQSEALTTAYAGGYVIVDTDFGTQTTVSVSSGVRKIVTNALPDHETGQFPNAGNPNTISAQSVNYEYPADPIYTGTAQEVHVPGVAVNGVKFEPGTAETVSCESGETYPVEGLQDQFNLGMDTNNAHVQPSGAYHYHGLPNSLTQKHNHSSSDLVHVGFAADGHFMYVSLASKYQSSYRLTETLRRGVNCTVSLGREHGPNIVINNSAPDGTYTSDWEYVDGLGDLDQCNGISIDGQYRYLITKDFPFISRCLKGVFTATRSTARPSGSPSSIPRGSLPAQPNLAVAAARLGVSEDQLRIALGPPPPDIEFAANVLGVSTRLLREILDESR